MKKSVALAACAVGFVSAPAYAQSTEVNPGGLRVEAIGGYDIVKITVDEEVAGEEVSDDEGGVAYGIAAGYDFFFTGGFIGAEVELADSTVGISDSYTGDLAGFDVDGSVSLDAGRDLYVGGRLGTSLDANSRVYVKAGYTNAKAILSVDGTIDGEDVSGSESATLDGWRLGFGGEYSFSRNTYAKAEYRYSTYNDGEAEVDGETFDVGEIFDYGDLERHQIVVGVGFRF